MSQHTYRRSVAYLRVLTPGTNRNWKLKRSRVFIEFSCVLLKKLKFVERTKLNSVVQNIHCASHFGDPSTVQSHPPPSSLSTPLPQTTGRYRHTEAKTRVSTLNLLQSSPLKWDMLGNIFMSPAAVASHGTHYMEVNSF
jgi:hypothetical protein